MKTTILPNRNKAIGKIHEGVFAGFLHLYLNGTTIESQIYWNKCYSLLRLIEIYIQQNIMYLNAPSKQPGLKGRPNPISMQMRSPLVSLSSFATSK